jgi:hypothetical protein
MVKSAITCMSSSPSYFLPEEYIAAETTMSRVCIFIVTMVTKNVLKVRI